MYTYYIYHHLSCVYIHVPLLLFSLFPLSSFLRYPFRLFIEVRQWILLQCVCLRDPLSHCKMISIIYVCCMALQLGVMVCQYTCKMLTGRVEFQLLFAVMRSFRMHTVYTHNVHTHVSMYMYIYCCFLSFLFPLSFSIPSDCLQKSSSGYLPQCVCSIWCVCVCVCVCVCG